MKILIVGTGAQGSVIATELAENPEVDEIKCADINLERAKQLANRLKKVTGIRVDAGNLGDLKKAAEGTSVIVNATLPKFNLNIMGVALKSGAHYLDLASGIDPDPYENLEVEVSKQLNLNDRWREAGLTALLGGGSSPGTTNVLAAYAADRLDRVEEIRLRSGWKTIKEGKEILSMWSPEIYWGCTVKPLVYENGKLREVVPFGEEEVYPFPDPVGPCVVAQMMFGHEEVVTFPYFIGKGVRYVDLKVPIDPVKKTIYELGLLGIESIDAKGVEVVPRDLFLSLIPPTPSMEEVEKTSDTGLFGESVGVELVDVKGEKAGKEVNYILYYKPLTVREVQEKIPGATDESFVTGTPAAIFAKMLAQDMIETTGVFPPECLEPKVREDFIAELAEKGINIYEKVERRLA
jgi:saccharopine dehydrogenase (NAD+, L-lysine-forming)